MRPEKIVKDFISHLKPKYLGLKRKTVTLIPHKKEWEEAFLWVSSQIKKEITALEIFHVGSTSVKALVAKPILDILVLFDSKTDQLASIEKLESLGFIHKGDGVALVTGEKPDQDRHFYSYYDLEEDYDYIHLHTYIKGHNDIKKLLTFRDRLRSDEKARSKYEILKKEIYQAGRTRRDYTRSKKNFVEKILEESS